MDHASSSSEVHTDTNPNLGLTQTLNLLTPNAKLTDTDTRRLPLTPCRMSLGRANYHAL